MLPLSWMAPPPISRAIVDQLLILYTLDGVDLVYTWVSKLSRVWC
jgi:hypothetical protein